MRLAVRLACRTAFTIALAAAAMAVAAPAAGSSRIKDITTVQGVRDNQLIGYGLVVGLSGSGDSLQNAPFTEQALKSMLDRMGVAVRGVQEEGAGRPAQQAAAAAQGGAAAGAAEAERRQGAAQGRHDAGGPPGGEGAGRGD